MSHLEWVVRSAKSVRVKWSGSTFIITVKWIGGSTTKLYESDLTAAFAVLAKDYMPS